MPIIRPTKPPKRYLEKIQKGDAPITIPMTTIPTTYQTATPKIEPKTDVLYGDELLPPEIKKERPIFSKLYELTERSFPCTGHASCAVALSLASMCVGNERRQFNLAIGATAGEGKRLIIEPYSQIPWVIFCDSYSASGFCLDLGGRYIKRLGTQIPLGVKLKGKGRYKDFSIEETIDLNRKFLVFKGLDRLFSYSPKVIDSTLALFNPLFEDGYGKFSDSFSGSYEFGSPQFPLKLGMIAMMTINDFDHNAVKRHGWLSRLIAVTYLCSEKENAMISFGIRRNKLPEIDISHHVRRLMNHLNPDYPIFVGDWGEEISERLDRIFLHIMEIRGEKQGKRASRDAKRLVEASAVLNKDTHVKISDTCIAEALTVMMRRKPEPLGDRLHFQVAIRKALGHSSKKVIMDMQRTFKNWNGKSLYSEDEIKKAIKRIEITNKKLTFF